MPVSNDQWNLHLAMAGTGNLYAVVTSERLPLLLLLRDHAGSTDDLADALGRPVDDVRDDIAQLADAGVVRVKGNTVRPSFLVVAEDDTGRVDAHACEVGYALADFLLQGWDTIEATFAEMSLGRAAPLREHAFMLVGDRLLDIALLDALARDGTLMPPAPPRPTRADPNARSFVWLIEGTWQQLGRYGQRASTLPWTGWELLTFGEYRYDGGPNTERDDLEAQVRATSPALASDPFALATIAGVAAVGTEDAHRWQRLTRQLANGLLHVYREHEAGIRELHASLAGAPKGSFGEFFCWYDHLAYAHAIDMLAEAQVLDVPAERFAAMLWYTSSDLSRF